VVGAVATGRNISAQLRRAVACYFGAKLALVAVLLGALGADLPSPFQPVHIVLLEIFMDLGASVAFIAEPAAPQAMRRPPRPAGARFLDRGVLTAIATTTATLTFAVLPAYLVLTAVAAGIGQARAGAVLAWLAVHALIAWTLRTQPRLPWTGQSHLPRLGCRGRAGRTRRRHHAGRRAHPARHARSEGAERGGGVRSDRDPAVAARRLNRL
jgi:Ca2+-transporting ATPase